MKKTITLIFIMILTLGFAGCDFKINNGKPIGIGDEIPTAVIVKSEDNRMKLETGETLRLSATVFPKRRRRVSFGPARMNQSLPSIRRDWFWEFLRER